MEVILVGFDGTRRVASVSHDTAYARLLSFNYDGLQRYFINRHGNVYDEVQCRDIGGEKADGGCADDGYAYKKTGPSVSGVDWTFGGGGGGAAMSAEDAKRGYSGSSACKDVTHVRVPLYRHGKLLGIHRVPSTFPGIIQIGLAFYTRQEAGGNWIYVDSGAPYALAITAGEESCETSKRST